MKIHSKEVNYFKASVVIRVGKDSVDYTALEITAHSSVSYYIFIME